jgi:hypothetical protein
MEKSRELIRKQKLSKNLKTEMEKAYLNLKRWKTKTTDRKKAQLIIRPFVKKYLKDLYDK